MNINVNWLHFLFLLSSFLPLFPSSLLHPLSFLFSFWFQVLESGILTTVRTVKDLRFTLLTAYMLAYHNQKQETFWFGANTVVRISAFALVSRVPIPTGYCIDNGEMPANTVVSSIRDKPLVYGIWIFYNGQQTRLSFALQEGIIFIIVAKKTSKQTNRNLPVALEKGTSVWFPCLLTIDIFEK